ncbi:hypothetical protein MPSEU_000852900 [Mayamaea pseudoterrestris]|nr:hypothetical protein MPSEU_000852900 [Mayamaea pseudoterrestris]
MPNPQATNEGTDDGIVEDNNAADTEEEEQQAVTLPRAADAAAASTSSFHPPSAPTDTRSHDANVNALNMSESSSTTNANSIKATKSLSAATNHKLKAAIPSAHSSSAASDELHNNNHIETFERLPGAFHQYPVDYVPRDYPTDVTDDYDVAVVHYGVTVQTIFDEYAAADESALVGIVVASDDDNDDDDNNDDNDDDAESNAPVSDVNVIVAVPATTVQGFYVKRRRLLWCIGALVCIVVIIGITVETSNEPTMTTQNVLPAAPLILPSTLEKLVLILHESTLTAIRNELPNVTGPDWYKNKAWTSQEDDKSFSPTSPQGKAWKWLMTQPDLENRTFVAVTEMFALVVLYYATDGPNWNNSSNWLVAEEDYRCYWWYAATDNFYMSLHNEPCLPSREGGIQYLDLSNNGLVGEVPIELALLTTLRDIRLNGNLLRGEIPEAVWQSWRANARPIHLHENNFSSTFPSIINSFPKITELLLQKNRFFGSLPLELFHLSSLVSLDLSANLFTGSINIPSDIRESLATLINLSQNSLSGPIPTALGLMTMLYTLQLNSNRLSGSIPTQLAGCTRLRFMDLANNPLLEGTIPSQIQEMTSLVTWTMHNTSISGALPSQLAQLTSLSSLDLSETRISGTLPTEFAQLPQLRILQFYKTNLSGSVPSQVCQAFSSVNANDGIVLDCASVQCDCNCSCV